MKYHYQQGIIEKDKKSHPKVWFFIFLIFALAIYIAFSYTTVALNGWPLAKYDKTAKEVKATKPGVLGDHLFIPAINVSVQIDDKQVALEGSPRGETFSISGAQIGIGFTPTQARNASPFFNIDQLKKGDQIFIDKDNVRYAYGVTAEPKEDVTVLTITNGKQKLYAEAIGTVAWQDGTPKLQTL